MQLSVTSVSLFTLKLNIDDSVLYVQEKHLRAPSKNLSSNASDASPTVSIDERHCDNSFFTQNEGM